MKPVHKCLVCGSLASSIVRQATVTRGDRRFATTWYRCSTCDDIRFAYRALPALDSEPPVFGGATAPPEREVESIPDTEPAGRR